MVAIGVILCSVYVRVEPIELPLARLLVDVDQHQLVQRTPFDLQIGRRDVLALAM